MKNRKLTNNYWDRAENEDIYDRDSIIEVITVDKYEYKIKAEQIKKLADEGIMFQQWK